MSTIINNQIKESVFLFEFDFLTSLHSYLDELIEYLVLYYCCFDAQSWIAVFYPLIQAGIGTYNCKMLFVQSHEDWKQVPSLFNETPSLREEMDRKEHILKETKVLSIFNRLIFHMLSGNNDDENNSNIVNYVLSIKNKLKEMTDNIKSQLQATDEMQLPQLQPGVSKNKKRKLMNGAQLGLCDLIHKNVSNIFEHLILKNNCQQFSIDGQYKYDAKKAFSKQNGKGKITNGDIYYHYFNEDELKSVLKSIECDSYKLNDDLINIICQYYCITQWSQLSNEKSNKISIYNSNDNMISYAIGHPNVDDSQSLNDHDTILLHTIIDKTIKPIYRFMFKNVLINNNDARSYIRIGILSKDCNQLGSDMIGDSYIGCDEDSICWSYYNYGDDTSDGGKSSACYPGECAFMHGGFLSKQIELNMNDSQSIDIYFLIEINLISSKFSVLIFTCIG